jgi:hypothetical protein
MKLPFNHGIYLFSAITLASIAFGVVTINFLTDLFSDWTNPRLVKLPSRAHDFILSV